MRDVPEAPGSLTGGWAAGVRERLTAWYAHSQHGVLDPDAFDEHSSKIVAARVPLSIVLRGAGRVFLLAYGVFSKSPTRLSRARLFGMVTISSIADATEIGWLRRSHSLGGRPRLARDVIETGAYAALLDDYTATSISGAPLLTEMAYRIGPASAALLLPHGVAAAVGRRSTRQPLALDSLYYLLVALVGGLGVRRSESERVRRHHAGRRAREEAIRDSAALTGRRRVALYALEEARHIGDTPLDAIGNLYPWLDLDDTPEGSPLRQVLENERERIWGGPAVVLRDAVERWSFEYGRKILRAADQVWEVAYDGRVGDVILTESQGEQLTAALTEFQPRGWLRLVPSGRTLFGAPVTVILQTAEKSVRATLLPDGPPSRFEFGDPTPAGPLLGALWAGAQATRAADHVAPRNTVPGVAAFLAAALRSDHLVRTRGARAHGRVITASVLAAAAQVAGVWREVKRTPARPNGTPRVPVASALIAPFVVTGFCWPSLTRRERVTAVAELATFVAIGTLALDRRKPVMLLLVNFVASPCAGAAGAVAYRRHAEADAAREEEAFDERLGEAVRRAAADAETAEWRLVGMAAAEATARLRSDLDPRVRARYQDSLQLVRDIALARVQDAAPVE